MQQTAYMLVALAVGFSMSALPAWNAIVARTLGSAMGAAAIHTFVAFVCIAALLPFTGAGRLTPSVLGTLPWWVYLAGLVGAAFVAAGVFIAPATGALVFFVCIVTGQLAGSVLADHFGAFGLAEREITPLRIAGIACVVIGAVLVRKG